MIDRRSFSAASLLVAGGFAAGVAVPAQARDRHARVAHGTKLPVLFDDIEERTFRWFWDTGNPANGLVPDNWPDPAF
ncbi:MAG TPA: Tat pathway signal protein, partial [Sphingomonas sp.]|nr:Tat pathway signal protein [Sphingomonas sp.]